MLNDNPAIIYNNCNFAVGLLKIDNWWKCVFSKARFVISSIFDPVWFNVDIRCAIDESI